jgi:tetraprenyl-beta-curcumene synthase
VRIASARREGLAFAAAARSYWLEVFPEVRRERERWRRRALAIPDPVLREDALLTIEEKWGHSEGAAAFAVLVPRATRGAFIRMVVAYQLMIDYLDTISERPVADPWANTLQLHGAAQNAIALAPAREPDYYMFHPYRGDDGFLAAQIQVCREVLTALPSSAAVGPRAEHLASLYAESQGHCHAEQAQAGSSAPTKRIDAMAARHPELDWGEVLAACNTSVPMFAMLALAASPGCSEVEVERHYSAYLPWTASLHILLHSMVDEAFDLAAGKFNQLGHYGSKPEAAQAVTAIAVEAREQLGQLPQAETHIALLAAMAGYYLSAPSAWEDENRLIAEPVLEALGPSARWSMLAHRLRRGLGGD